MAGRLDADLAGEHDGLDANVQIEFGNQVADIGS
jgi:hypothetical protein